MRECGTAFGTGALFIIVEKWEWPSINHVNGQKNLHKGQWNGPAIKTHSLQALGPEFDSKTHGTRRELAPGSCPLISTHALWPMVNPHLSLSPSPSLLSSSSPSCSFSLLPALIHIQTLTCKIIFFLKRENSGTSTKWNKIQPWIHGNKDFLSSWTAVLDVSEEP